MPVVTSIAVRKGGTADLLKLTDDISAKLAAEPAENSWRALSVSELRATQREADRIISDCVSLPSRPDTLTARI
ncbi:hypothetical protein, partial [Pseudomonas sp. FW300-E2]|uniref:hypothetical protein n=1 Tax=Pseudomonas sp. FW300-E2 TaxID=2070650 RepID=UPI001C497A51